MSSGWKAILSGGAARETSPSLDELLERKRDQVRQACALTESEVQEFLALTRRNTANPIEDVMVCELQQIHPLLALIMQLQRLAGTLVEPRRVLDNAARVQQMRQLREALVAAQHLSRAAMLLTEAGTLLLEAKAILFVKLQQRRGGDQDGGENLLHHESSALEDIVAKVTLAGSLIKQSAAAKEAHNNPIFSFPAMAPEVADRVAEEESHHLPLAIVQEKIAVLRIMNAVTLSSSAPVASMQGSIRRKTSSAALRQQTVVSPLWHRFRFNTIRSHPADGQQMVGSIHVKSGCRKTSTFQRIFQPKHPAEVNRFLLAAHKDISALSSLSGEHPSILRILSYSVRCTVTDAHVYPLLALSVKSPAIMCTLAEKMVSTPQGSSGRDDDDADVAADDDVGEVDSDASSDVDSEEFDSEGQMHIASIGNDTNVDASSTVLEDLTGQQPNHPHHVDHDANDNDNDDDDDDDDDGNEFVDVNSDDDTASLVSDDSEGGHSTFEDFLSVHEKRRIVRQLVSGLGFLHTQATPVVHGFLNPKSVLLTEDMQVKISGFEWKHVATCTTTTTCSQAQTQTDGRESQAPEHSPTWFSPLPLLRSLPPGERDYQFQYIAPEVLRGEGVSTAADIYSLGVMTWELATSKASFCALATEHHMSVMDTVLAGKRPPINHYGMPLKDFEELAEYCWHEEPAKRPDAALIGGNLALFGSIWMKPIDTRSNPMTLERAIEIVEMHTEDGGPLLSRALRLLMIYSREKGVKVAAVDSERLFRSLHAALLAHKHDIQVQGQGFLVVASCATGQQKVPVGIDFVEHVTEMMDLHRSCTELQRCACWALTNLVSRTETPELRTDDKVMYRIVRALNSFATENVDLYIMATKWVCNMSLKRQNRAILIKAGVLTGLKEGMVFWRAKNEESQEEALIAIRNLCVQCPQAVAAVYDHGLLQEIFQAKLQYLDSPAIHYHAHMMLWNIAANNPETLKHVHEAGGIPLLCDALQRLSHQRERLDAALACIASVHQMLANQDERHSHPAMRRTLHALAKVVAVEVIRSGFLEAALDLGLTGAIAHSSDLCYHVLVLIHRIAEVIGPGAVIEHSPAAVAKQKDFVARVMLEQDDLQQLAGLVLPTAQVPVVWRYL